MSDGRDTDSIYRVTTRISSAVILVIGLAMVVMTLANGGGAGAIGLWLGLLFSALGAGRLYLSLRS